MCFYNYHTVAEVAATADMCYIQDHCASAYGTDFALAVGKMFI